MVVENGLGTADQVEEAVKDGVDLIALSTGQMSKRYGMIYVNKQDDGTGVLSRSKKDSFEWYKKAIQNNGLKF